MDQDLQISFFKSLKQNASHGVDLAGQIGALLKLNRSAVYNRINGKTRLNVDEMRDLILAFDVDYPLISREVSGTDITVSLTSLFRQPSNSIEYLSPILAQLQLLGGEKSVLIRYVTSEILLFYVLQFPLLAKFKFFVWKYFTWDRETRLGGGRLFDKHSAVSSEEAFYFNAVRRAYDDFPSSEIWHSNVLDNTLYQIQYLESTGHIKDPKIRSQLYKDIHDLLDMLELRVAAGRKPSGAPYQLFQNEATHTNNMILVQAEFQSVVYFTYDNPNLCRTTDPKIIAYTRDTINNLERHCIPLSVTSEKARNFFFSTLHDRVRAQE
ncbi:MAG: hypothetical protein K9I85_13090 [Saprospiraceae bacterium]|nr:hypothetical protein [Saprospiraceae bacterium]